MTDQTATKTCSRCREEKPETAFHRAGSGRRSECIACRNEARRDADRLKAFEPPSQDAVARFWAKVEKTDGCWIWTGPIGNADLYGRFYAEGRH